jgi:cell division protein ZapA
VQNKVTVTIDGQEYTLVASEDASYMKKVAAHVDSKIAELREGGKISGADAAVLAALNMADEYFKGLETAENLRAQIKESLEESKKLNLELSEAKREIFKLQTQGKK